MASFVQDLWSSIFTPGPTPTLLVATNATFAALQVLLFALLLATYSIHFVVLSFLSGTLWWGVNWFANEVQQAQVRAEEEQRKTQQVKGEQDEKQKATGVDERTGSETETETEGASRARRRAPRSSSQTQPTAKGLAGVPGEGASGYVSTDSDWEKVESEKAP
ncbi:hypothetical protein VTN31DRAFT_2627 [Thermomyces dupontii]|uniref:uncharacterized protein n=1 Tax=Talaromyces thermophilus TaxID=28565 RepID=UPI0037420B70